MSLALAYLVLVIKQGEVIALLDLNGLRSLPSILQALHLFAIGGLCGWLGLMYPQLALPHSRLLPWALMSLCLFGGVDELTKLHLVIHQVDWRSVYLALLAAVPVIGWRDLIWLWHSHRSVVVWLVMGLTIFLLGGFGAEALKGVIAAATYHSVQITFLSEHVRITFEETAELLGESVILYAFTMLTMLLTADQKTVTSPDGRSRISPP
ncbi:MAG: hypothetical protein ACFBSG_18980 [Leptolyngbyaceae cyanobacterium]